MSREIDVPEKAHAELGASVASRWMNCPGSIQLSRTVPTPPTTSHAQEGTAAHSLAELCLRKAIDPDTYVGTTLEGVEITDDMADFVRIYVDHCRSLQLPGVQSWVERKITLAKLNPPGPMFGTADFTAYNPYTRTLHVADLKYGQGILVEAEGNPQLIYYALGALLSMPAGTRVDTVSMAIVQPRMAHAEGVVRPATLDIIALVEFAGELIAAARATTAPDAPLVPGRWCRFCPAGGVCPARHRQAQEIAQTEFALMPVQQPPAPATISPAHLAAVLPKLELLEDWVTNVRQHAHAMLERGEEVPGYKLVERRATRKWTDEESAQQTLEAMGLAPDALTTAKLKSPAQIEKVLGKRKKELPVQYITKESSGLKMVPTTDPTPAVTLTRGEEFGLLPSPSSH